jgi:hypothetical protein
VTVLDANDHAPVFSAPLYDVAVPEDAAPGTSVVTLLCRDKDHMAPAPTSSPLLSPERNTSSTDGFVSDSAGAVTPLFFSLEHGEALNSAELFSVDSASGVVSVAQPLDR